MAGIGPPRKPVEQRRRRNPDAASTVKLPAKGRTGAAPAWPLTGRPPALWASLWATPQAVAWERLRWTRIVARYTRILTWCENPKTSTAALLSEARQLEDRLGLSPMSMFRLRWEIDADELADKRDAAVKPRRALRIVAAPQEESASLEAAEVDPGLRPATEASEPQAGTDGQPSGRPE